MSWHYRIRKRTINGKPWYDIVEYYFKPTPETKGGGWTRDGMTPGGETRATLIRELEMMLADAKKYRTVVEKESL